MFKYTCLFLFFNKDSYISWRGGKKQKVSKVGKNNPSLYTDDNIAQAVWRIILSPLQILPHSKPHFSVQ